MRPEIVKRKLTPQESKLRKAATKVVELLEKAKETEGRSGLPPRQVRAATPAQLLELSETPEFKAVLALMRDPLMRGAVTISVKENSSRPLVFCKEGFQIVDDGRRLEDPTREDLQSLFVSKSEACSKVVSAGLRTARGILAALEQAQLRRSDDTDLTQMMRMVLAAKSA